ncbi:MAG: phosphate ABC transporter substrate-binding protein PstS [Parvibaculaceae bacterium]
MKIWIPGFLITIGLFLSGGPALAERIHGAGSTFASPVITQWSASHLKDRAGGDDIHLMNAGIDYEPVGSIGGIHRLGEPEMHFALSDVALPPAELMKFGYVQFPIVIGGIVPVINLDGIGPGELRLSGALLADIFLGKIRNWSDPAIAALNPGLALPDLAITVVHRTYDSGSTFHWTSFLSRSSPEWKSRHGAATLIDWPVGVAAVRSAGMARVVKETKGAIGYIEYGQVQRASLIYAAVDNHNGQPIRPHPRAFTTATAELQWSADNDFFISSIDAASDGAYPLTAVTFVLLRREPLSERAMWFFNFALEKGAADAEALGYAALPPALVDQVRAYWMAELGYGK